MIPNRPQGQYGSSEDAPFGLAQVPQGLAQPGPVHLGTASVSQGTASVSHGPASSGSVPLPSGWDVGKDYDGKIYYIDHNNKKTTWVDPRER